MTKRKSEALSSANDADADKQDGGDKKVCTRTDNAQSEIIVLNCEAEGKVSHVAISKAKLIQHSEFFRSKFSDRWTPKEDAVSDEIQLSVYHIQDFDPLAVKIVFEMLLKYDMMKNTMNDFGVLAEMFRVCDYYGIKVKSVIRAIEKQLDSVPLLSTCIMSAMKAVVCLEKIEQFKQVANKLEDRVTRFMKNSLTTPTEVMSFVVYYNKGEYCSLVTRVLASVSKLMSDKAQPNNQKSNPLVKGAGPAAPTSSASSSDDSSSDEEVAPQPAPTAPQPAPAAPLAAPQPAPAAPPAAPQPVPAARREPVPSSSSSDYSSSDEEDAPQPAPTASQPAAAPQRASAAPQRASAAPQRASAAPQRHWLQRSRAGDSFSDEEEPQLQRRSRRR